MSSKTQYIPHYTYEDYAQWEGEWELWNGVAVAMTPSPFGRHQWIAGQILSQINRQMESGCRGCYALCETDWIVSDDTVVRPDVAVVCGKFPERFIESPPALIVEVASESTEEKDRTAKFDLYEQQAVSHYLIIDPKSKIIQAFGLSETSHYQPLPFADSLTLRLNPSCLITLHFQSLFPT